MTKPNTTIINLTCPGCGAFLKNIHSSMEDLMKSPTIICPCTKRFDNPYYAFKTIINLTCPGCGGFMKKFNGNVSDLMKSYIIIHFKCNTNIRNPYYAGIFNGLFSSSKKDLIIQGLNKIALEEKELVEKKLREMKENELKEQNRILEERLLQEKQKQQDAFEENQRIMDKRAEEEKHQKEVWAYQKKLNESYFIQEQWKNNNKEPKTLEQIKDLLEKGELKLNSNIKFGYNTQEFMPIHFFEQFNQKFKDFL